MLVPPLVFCLVVQQSSALGWPVVLVTGLAGARAVAPSELPETDCFVSGAVLPLAVATGAEWAGSLLRSDLCRQSPEHSH